MPEPYKKIGALIGVVVIALVSAVVLGTNFIGRNRTTNRSTIPDFNNLLQRQRPSQTSTSIPPSTMETVSIDFYACPDGRNSVAVAFGSTTYEITGKRQDKCEISYGGEIENPNWDGQLNTNCQVPVSLGKIEFETTQYGIDFSPIKNFCVTKK